MIAILFIYVALGVGSLFSSFLRSGVWAVVLLPFMLIYFLFFGKSQRRKEAITVLKVILLGCGVYAFLWLTYLLCSL